MFIVSNSDYRSNRYRTDIVYFDSSVPHVEIHNYIFGFCFTVPPVIHVPNQLVGAPLGTDVVLECFVEASPKSINYWVKDPTGMQYLVIQENTFDTLSKYRIMQTCNIYKLDNKTYNKL